MKFFADTCDLSAIKELRSMDIVQGVTTNPLLVRNASLDIEAFAKDALMLLEDDLHIQVQAHECDEIVEQAKHIAALSSKIVIKLPLTLYGLKACKQLRALGIRTNMTLCFSPAQALMAAKAGASYVSLFIGRLDDTGYFGLDLVGECCAIFENYPEITTQIIVASIRGPMHIVEVAKLGVDIVTAPPKVLLQCVEHPLTSAGIQLFSNAQKGEIE